MIYYCRLVHIKCLLGIYADMIQILLVLHTFLARNINDWKVCQRCSFLRWMPTLLKRWRIQLWNLICLWSLMTAFKQYLYRSWDLCSSHRTDVSNGNGAFMKSRGHSEIPHGISSFIDLQASTCILCFIGEHHQQVVITSTSASDKTIWFCCF